MSTEREPHHQALSDAVRLLMARHDEGVSALAAAIDHHQSNLSGKLNGTRAWRFDDLFALADHYRMKPSELLAAAEATSVATANLPRKESA